MAIVLLNQASTELARSFIRDIANENDIYYFYVARTQVWSDEENVESPVDSVRYINESRKNILMVKRIVESDVALVANRFNWESGVVYDQYDDRIGENGFRSHSGEIELSKSIFYVMTEDFNVYKCLSNNNETPSTFQPTGQSISPFNTEDGYTWKFMFQVTQADRNKFLTPDYIPVRKMSGTGSPLFDVNGFLDGVEVVETGSGYIEPPLVTVLGDGQGAVVYATLDNGQVSEFVVEEPGDGYTFARIVITSASGDPGSGAEGRAILGAKEVGIIQETVENASVEGTIDRIDLVAGGQDYVNGDIIVDIIGDGEGAEAIARADDVGKIYEIEVVNPGSGYTFAEITIRNGTVGVAGADATARAIVSPIWGHGGNPPRELFADKVCISVNLDNETSDYFYNNDFRQIGIIKNPIIYDYTAESPELYMDITGTTLHRITVNEEDFDKFNYDDVVATDSQGRFVVVSKDAATFGIGLLHEIDNIELSSKLTIVNTEYTNLTINTLEQPEVDTKHGFITYIDNRLRVVRQEDQVEKIRTILQF